MTSPRGPEPGDRCGTWGGGRGVLGAFQAEGRAGAKALRWGLPVCKPGAETVARVVRLGSAWGPGLSEGQCGLLGWSEGLSVLLGWSEGPAWGPGLV